MKIARLVAGTVTAVVVVGIVAVGAVHANPLPAATGASTTGASTTVAAAQPAPAATADTAPPVTVAPVSVPAPVAVSAAVPVAVSASTPALIGAQAVALISYPWAQLGYRLAFHGPKAGFLGLTDCRAHTIDIYVTAGQTVAQVEYITAFEIAHAVDCTYTSAAREAQWPVLRGYQSRGGWFPNCSCSENSYASGDFADVFARWQAGAVYPWRSALAPAPSAAQLATLVPFLEG